MTHSTIIRSTLVAVLLTAVSTIAPTTVVFAAEDAARPHHNNDEAQTCKHEGKHHGEHHAKHHRRSGKPSADEMQQFRERMEQLKLSDAQKQDMAALMGIYQPRFKALRDRGQTDREVLFEALPDAANYSALVDKVSSEAGKTASEVIVLLAEMQANAYDLLSKAQQSEYLELKAKAKERIEAAREKAKQRARTHRESSDKDY